MSMRKSQEHTQEENWAVPLVHLHHSTRANLFLQTRLQGNNSMILLLFWLLLFYFFNTSYRLWQQNCWRYALPLTVLEIRNRSWFHYKIYKHVLDIFFYVERQLLKVKQHVTVVLVTLPVWSKETVWWRESSSREWWSRTGRKAAAWLERDAWSPGPPAPSELRPRTRSLRAVRSDGRLTAGTLAPRPSGSGSQTCTSPAPPTDRSSATPSPVTRNMRVGNVSVGQEEL